MFAATRDGAGSCSDTLSIFHAAHLRGPWQPHAGNPILVDQSCARPAGAFVRRHGKLWRPVQDCRGGYGTGIGLAEVMRLDPDGFAQKLHGVIRPAARMAGPAAAHLEPGRAVRMHRRRRVFAAQPHSGRQARRLVRPARINHVRRRKTSGNAAAVGAGTVLAELTPKSNGAVPDRDSGP